MHGTDAREARIPIAGREDAEAPQPARARVTKAFARWPGLASETVVIVCGVLAAIVISIAATVFIVKSQSVGDSVRYALQIENKLVLLRAMVRDAESRQRGFLLTDDPSYLEDYQASARTAMAVTAALKAAIADDPALRRAFASVEPLLDRRMELLRVTSQLYQSGDRQGAIDRVRSGIGRDAMKKFVASVEDIILEEQGLLQARLARSADINFVLLALVLLGALLTVGLAILAVRIVRRSERALQKKNGELQALVKELEAFSYSISHDLRAPLRAIDAFSRILLKECAKDLAPKMRDYLQTVTNNARQMGQLVDDLLHFSRLGRKPLSKQRVPTTALVREVLRDVRQQQGEGRAVNVTVGELPEIWGDPALLKQAFANLIDNAFKYTRKRDKAEIEIGSCDEAGKRIFFVRDNGVGFDPQYAGKLFGVFERLHRAEDFEGTGVGLAIVQRVVQRHGGQIWADAAVDKGATFKFTLEG